MKFCNKIRRARQHWTRIESDSTDFLPAKLWCQRNNSVGRFFGKIEKRTQERMRIGANGSISFAQPITVWYFESKEDATAFRLAWVK